MRFMSWYELLNKLKNRDVVLGELLKELYDKFKEIDSIIETIDIIANDEEYRKLIESIEEAIKGETYPVEELINKLKSRSNKESN